MPSAPSLLAHSARDGCPPQGYAAHVNGVVAYAAAALESLRPFAAAGTWERATRILRAAAAYHDLGKLDGQNQDVLNGTARLRLPLEHRDAGVAALLQQSSQVPAQLVYSHHAPGFPAFGEQKVLSNSWRFEDLAHTDAHLPEYLARHRESGAPVPAPADSAADSKLESALEYRLPLSCLVDADYSDTSGQPPESPPTRWSERLQSLDAYVAGLGERTESHRNALRAAFYQACREADTGASLEYCDAPVGSGKTTAVLAHMLRKAIAGRARHIFVVLPFVGIITQSVRILREALTLPGEDPSEVVAELHHLADFDDIRLRALAGNWRAPVIVTTAVQFFETLASNQPARLRKLHQLPGSLVILDESHAALPTHLLPLAWRWMVELTRRWGCGFCFASGTVCRFWEKLPAAPAEVTVRPLLGVALPDVLRDGWEASCRMPENLVFPATILKSCAALRDQIIAAPGPQVVVLNTIRAAASLAWLMRCRGDDVLHLSTALTPDDRETVIDEIRRRLRADYSGNRHWTLVATSCIECGLDFSFHSGFCEERSLQSCLQLLGRVSRHHEYPDARVVCFRLREPSLPEHRGLVLARKTFRNQIEQKLIFGRPIADVVTHAFVEEQKERGGPIGQELIRCENVKDFPKVAAQFLVIDELGFTVIADPDLAAAVAAGKRVPARELMRHSVSVSGLVRRELGLADTELAALRPEQYDAFLGYMKTLVTSPPDGEAIQA